MKKHLTLCILLLSCLSVTLSTAAATNVPLIQNTDNRLTSSLNGDWNYIVDPYENGYYDYRYEAKDQKESPGSDAYFMNRKPNNKSDRTEYDFDTSPTMKVPGDWNHQEDKFFYYEGTVWLKKSFDYSKKHKDNRVFVHFGATNYESHVYLNGTKLGYHEGGFTPFNFEVSQLLKAKDNFLIVKVDNKRRRDAVPTLNTDWWNYGGITRDVSLVETPATFIRDYKVQLKKGKNNVIAGFVQLDGTAAGKQKVTLAIPKLKLKKTLRTDQNGFATFEVKAKDIALWSPLSPTLYQVTLSSTSASVQDQIGFRTISVKGADILLNDKPIFLRGISLHEENPLRGGRAYSKEDALMMIRWAKELGCNFIRLAHYPHNENMLRAADELGMMVWDENPVYWTILFEREDVYQNAENQLREMITRDKNRASVIIWSMANETPRGDARLKFLTRIAKTARELDDTRLISAALEKHYVAGTDNILTVDDRFADQVDILSFNEYVGWYDGLPTKNATLEWDIKQNKPVFISEFGGGALQGYHGDRMTMWTEEHQEYLYQESIAMLRKIPQLRGMSPWILVDFRSPRRNLPNIQDGWNRKGLISSEGKKKKAFYVLQDYYKEMESKWQ
ncbi:beta-glucuronidase [Alteromonadaceae bacterium Bs31]|nr:beta-glucuronidase [Alteromonadaceae bacterium Bs31]